MLNWLKSLSFKQKRRDRRIEKNTGLSEESNLHRELKPASKNSHHHSRRRSGHLQKHHEKYLADATIIPRGEHGISRKQIDPQALKVLYRLNKAGFQACLVGGAVRDLILGYKPKDFDVATDATPEEVNELFRNCRLIGRRFRLAHVHFGRLIIEVATYRADHGRSLSGSLDESGRIVRDNVYGNISDDVWRRDFTANALYYDISNFTVIDFVGGMDDIRHRRLKMIGDAETRYREDPVRMLRAIRFAAKLDFSIEQDSKDLIHELGYLLQDISPARLYEEALKLFHSGHALKSYKSLNEYHLMQYLFPSAAVAIEEDDRFASLLKLAMANTDERIRNDLRVTPAFLFAALLWLPVSTRAKEISRKGMPYSVAIQKAATAVMSQQVKSISIPKRFTSTMRDIWGLQTRFHYRKGKRAMAVLEHPKFRAAYDFLCLRAEVGEDVADDCQFWTEFQKQLPAGAHDRVAVPTSKQQPGHSRKKSSSDTAEKSGGKNHKKRRRPRRKKTDNQSSDR